ncbi:MAG: hypothetical protein R2822_12945 [Spirosomataceae bacterium]
MPKNIYERAFDSQSTGVTQMVKSKSMLTEECHLNPFLEQNGVEVIDTDLGERIVQLADEPPSHIVLPCIHWKKEEIGILFHISTSVRLRLCRSCATDSRCPRTPKRKNL